MVFVLVYQTKVQTKKIAAKDHSDSLAAAMHIVTITAFVLLRVSC
jgi:hypothetical protein